MNSNIRDLLLNEIEEYIIEIGEKKFRAKQIYEWLWQKSADDFSGMTNVNKSLRGKLEDKFDIFRPVIIYKQKSRDNTIKVGFKLSDEQIIEGVLIPVDNRITACISSQVGCNLGCKFCATAKLGFTRNLYAGEIADQVQLLNDMSKKEFNAHLSNIVLMGMGEPLLNYKNVVRSVEIITGKDGLAFSPQRVTLSTIGLPKMIKKLADDNLKINLAISLHSASNKIRSDIMPVNKSDSLEDLSQSMVYFNEKTGKRITIEYLLLKGINDSITDAEELAQFCKSFPVKLNIIEYNPSGDKRFQKSDEKELDAFVTFLKSKNLIVNIRRSRGKDIDAACGQLAGKIRK